MVLNSVNLGFWWFVFFLLFSSFDFFCLRFQKNVYICRLK